MSSLPSADMQVQLVTVPQQFSALRPEWNGLSDAQRSVFLTHEWFDAAWQWRAVDSTLAVILVRHDNALLGALPLVDRLVPRSRM